MRGLTLYCLGIFLLTLSSCSRAQQPTTVKEEPTTENGELLKGKKVLIVYMSRTKNTKEVAEMIHKKVISEVQNWLEKIGLVE